MAFPSSSSATALAIAFLAGVLLTLGLKELCPEIEPVLQRTARSKPRPPQKATPQASPATSSRYTFRWPIQLEDNEPTSTADSSTVATRGNGIAHGIEGTIGNTPLVELPSLSAATGRTILAKAEFLNGAGNSPKDRVALSVIAEAERAGHIVPGRGDTIYEGTVGSTGIAIAALARAKGFKAHVCMPDDQALEKSDLLRHLGAEVERVPVQPITSPVHYVNLARRRAKEHAAAKGDGSVGFFADQFENEANVHAHEEGTGPEIWKQTRGKIDVFVAGAGTGGTLSGVARYLKLTKQAGDVLVICADPQGSGLYHRIEHGVMYSPTEREGTRRRTQVDSLVEGIGINRVVRNFELGRDLVDGAVRVTDAQACAMASWLSRKDGVFVGSSSAVNCVGAVMASLRVPEGSVVVTILCDSGARHLSKFWKRIGDLGDIAEGDDLMEVLGLMGRGSTGVP